jgi:murein DD-endopeptidase MepM/ murein hydrolase activator NlpD
LRHSNIGAVAAAFAAVICLLLSSSSALAVSRSFYIPKVIVIPMELKEIYKPVEDTRVTSPMGYRVHPVTKKHCFHNGTDFSADLDDPVYNLLDGVVVQSGSRGPMGLAVEIFHPSANVRTIIGHLNAYAVKPGQWIERGRVVGYAGSTGRSTGVHVHYSVRDAKGEWIDPLTFIEKVPAYSEIAQKQSSGGKPVISGKFGKYGAVKVSFVKPTSAKPSAARSKIASGKLSRHTPTAARVAFRWDVQVANS